MKFNVKSWHFPFLGFLIIFMLQTYSYARGMIACGEKGSAMCSRLYSWKYAIYLGFLVVFFLIPTTLLRIKKTRKIGAALNVLLALVVLYGALFESDSARDMGMMIIFALLFFAGGAFSFLKESRE